MGRVKVPRCDNCGAPVEFAPGAQEARCEYCNEVLIRELAPPPPAPAPQWPAPLPPPAARARKTSVAPFVIVGLATLAIAGASSFATLASHLKPLPEPAPVVVEKFAGASAIQLQQPLGIRPSDARSGTQKSQPAETATRARPRTRSTASALPTAAASAEPAKAPPFNSQAATAGLDTAKAKAEASCRASSRVTLFVQMGFEPGGSNRGAALSDPRLKDTPEAKCALRIFRAVRIPPFDPATRPSGLGRSLRL